MVIVDRDYGYIAKLGYTLILTCLLSYPPDKFVLSNRYTNFLYNSTPIQFLYLSSG